jgi:arginyl-tRNA synthetase
VIPGDIGAELAAAIASGELPPAAAGHAAAGTWRLPPRAGPGSYATSLPFPLARAAGQDPAAVAARLAARLSRLSWVSAAAQAGGGYLTVTVTAAALAGLATRVVAAGGGCARSDALAGTTVTAPGRADLAAASGWDEARRRVAAAATGRLATAAGAKTKPERLPSPAAVPPGRPGPVSAAVAFCGADAVRYLLVRSRASPGDGIDVAAGVESLVARPYFAVRYAHADAASALRWAAGLGLDGGPPAAFRADLLGHPSELALLAAISWMPERVASAARRRRPDHFARYLEFLAVAWLDCRERCPALPFGGRAAPREQAGIAARLWLAAAARTAFGTGLRLLGIEPPDRL